jgi:hypothetical protein
MLRGGAEDMTLPDIHEGGLVDRARVADALVRSSADHVRRDLPAGVLDHPA